MNAEIVTIVHTEEGLTIHASEEIGGRKSYPNTSQSAVEKLVMKIHTAVKGISSYKSVYIGLNEIDHYDSCNEFEVPCASIRKGQRKAEDRSYMSNDIPKGWDMDVQVCFDSVQKIANPLKKALDALGVRVDVKEVQRMLKKNKGRAYINGKTTSSGMWNQYTSTTYSVDADDNRYEW
jgi:hypothetical protein